MKSVLFSGGLLLCVLFFLQVNPAYSQNNVDVSVSNVTQYGIGKESGIFGNLDKEYFENFTDVRLRTQGFTVGFRLELRKPAEFGPDEQGLTKRYIQYQRDGLKLRAGDLYGMFNRGLAMNLFEDRVIRYDTGLDGLLAEYDTEYFTAMIMGGEIDYLEQLTFDDRNLHRERHSIRAATVEFKPIREIRFGGSFVRSESRIPDYPFNEGISDTSLVRNHIPEGYIRLRLPFADLNLGYAHKFTEVEQPNDTLSTDGSAFYATLSHTGRGYGITIEYKDYRYDIQDPLNDFNFLRPTRMMPFQNPPIVHKQHSYSLMSREPHLVNFNDEVGFFVDAFYSVSPRLLLNASFAVASQHYAYELDLDVFEFNEVKKGPAWLPSFNRERNPFWEVYFDAEYLFSDFMTHLKLGYNYRDFYDYDALVPDFSYPLRQHNLLGEFNYSVSPLWNVKLTTEYQFEHSGVYLDDADSYSQLMTLQISRSPLFSIAGRYEFTTSKSDPSGDKNWYFVEGSYRIGNSHTVTAGYGSERGGVVCTNGICRVVNAFEGFRFSLVSTF